MNLTEANLDTGITCDRCDERTVTSFRFEDESHVKLSRNPHTPNGENVWHWCTRCVDDICTQFERIQRDMSFQDRCNECTGRYPGCKPYSVGIKTDIRDPKDRYGEERCPVCIAYMFRNCWRGIATLELEEVE